MQLRVQMEHMLSQGQNKGLIELNEPKHSGVHKAMYAWQMRSQGGHPA